MWLLVIAFCTTDPAGLKCAIMPQKLVYADYESCRPYRLTAVDLITASSEIVVWFRVDCIEILDQ